jgi:hypothetical protein
MFQLYVTQNKLGSQINSETHAWQRSVPHAWLRSVPELTQRLHTWQYCCRKIASFCPAVYKTWNEKVCIRDLSPVTVATIRTASASSHFVVVWSMFTSQGPASLCPLPCSNCTWNRDTCYSEKSEIMLSFNLVSVVDRCGCARLSFWSVWIRNVDRYLFGRD